MKCWRFCLVSRVSLHFFTNHLNNLSNMAFDMAPTEYATWSLLRPWVTNSLPTLILGFSKFLYMSAQSTPKRVATRSPSYNQNHYNQYPMIYKKKVKQKNVKLNVKFQSPLFHQLQPVLHDLSVWISCHPCAWQRQWFCRYRSSPLGWNRGHRRLSVGRILITTGSLEVKI